MKQQVDIALRLSLWIDATFSPDRIEKLVRSRMKKAFATEASPMLDPFRLLSIREEASIFGTELDDQPARFDGYEIHGVKEFGEPGDRFCEQVGDDEAEFWSLYGHIPGQGVDCIGDFTTREHADEVFARITGRSYSDKSANTEER